MPVHFEIYAPDGTLQLSTETRPVGRHKEYIDWKDTSGGRQGGPYIIDPENKVQISQRDFRSFGYPRIGLKDGYMHFMQLNDGAVISFSPDYGSCIGPQADAGRVLMADMREYNPTPMPNERLQVFSPTGQMVWGSESLIHSIQLIDWTTLYFGDHTYRTVPPLFFEIPSGIDPRKVFYLVNMRNAMFYPPTETPEGVMQYPLLYLRRRGNRIYVLPDFFIYFNTFTRYLTQDFNSKLSDATASTELNVLIMYVPGAA
ncbi:hypothetical protein ACSIQ7_003229 [Acinetobacter baumannii]